MAEIKGIQNIREYQLSLLEKEKDTLTKLIAIETDESKIKKLYDKLSVVNKRIEDIKKGE